MQITSAGHHFKRFETIIISGVPTRKREIIVKVKNEDGRQTLTVKRIWFSKYRFINFFIRLCIKIKYF